MAREPGYLWIKNKKKYSYKYVYEQYCKVAETPQAVGKRYYDVVRMVANKIGAHPYVTSTAIYQYRNDFRIELLNKLYKINA